MGVFIATVQSFEAGQKMEPQELNNHRTHFRHYEIPSIQLPILLLSFLFLKMCVYMHSHECILVNMYVCLGLCVCICMWTWGKSSSWHPMSSSSPVQIIVLSQNPLLNLELCISTDLLASESHPLVSSFSGLGVEVLSTMPCILYEFWASKAPT